MGRAWTLLLNALGRGY